MTQRRDVILRVAPEDAAEVASGTEGLVLSLVGMSQLAHLTRASFVPAGQCRDGSDAEKQQKKNGGGCHHCHPKCHGSVLVSAEHGEVFDGAPAAVCTASREVAAASASVSLVSALLPEAELKHVTFLVYPAMVWAYSFLSLQLAIKSPFSGHCCSDKSLFSLVQDAFWVVPQQFSLLRGSYSAVTVRVVLAGVQTDQ